MKRLFTLSLLLSSAICFGQNSQIPLNQFKKKLKQFDTLFSTPPVVLITEDLSVSPTGKVSFLDKFENVGLASYDVQKTSSVVSPYTAYALLKIKVLSNVSFGNVKSRRIDGVLLDVYGFETVSQAYGEKTFATCSISKTGNDDTNEWCVGEIKIIYAYQEGKWVYKGVDTETENRIHDGLTRHNISEGILNKYFK